MGTDGYRNQFLDPEHMYCLSKLVHLVLLSKLPFNNHSFPTWQKKDQPLTHPENYYSTGLLFM